MRTQNSPRSPYTCMMSPRSRPLTKLHFSGPLTLKTSYLDPCTLAGRARISTLASYSLSSPPMCTPMQWLPGSGPAPGRTGLRLFVHKVSASTSSRLHGEKPYSRIQLYITTTVTPKVSFLAPLHHK